MCNVNLRFVSGADNLHKMLVFSLQAGKRGQRDTKTQTYHVNGVLSRGEFGEIRVSPWVFSLTVFVHDTVVLMQGRSFKLAISLTPHIRTTSPWPGLRSRSVILTYRT